MKTKQNKLNYIKVSCCDLKYVLVNGLTLESIFVDFDWFWMFILNIIFGT